MVAVDSEVCLINSLLSWVILFLFSHSHTSVQDHFFFLLDQGTIADSGGNGGLGQHLPHINPGQSNSYPNSTNGNGRYNVNRAYNVAGITPPQFGNQSVSDGVNRATSAGMHGRVDWKAKYLK